MNLNQLKEGLRAKITSREQLLALWKTCGGTSGPYQHGATTGAAPLSVSIADMDLGRTIWYSGGEPIGNHWWWYREQMRIKLLYPPATGVLEQLVEGMGMHQYCIHPSTDPQTPYAVAYTPDEVSGMADRQLKVSSLAKLIKKLCILVSDEHAQKLEAMHRAELDPSFELATSPDDVEMVYREMDGDTGCMRYGPSHWGLPDGFHPSHVYADVPGMGVAYHKRGDRIVSRAVVFETAEGTKHWLRIYGDGALRKKLERNGYTERALAGQKIRAIALPENMHGSDVYMVPYIDGGGGQQSNFDGTYGLIDRDEPGFIKMMSHELATKLSNAGVPVKSFKAHTDVAHRLPMADLSSLKFVCPLTGITVDRTTDGVFKVLYRGEVREVLTTPDARRRFGQSIYVWTDRWVSIRCEGHEPRFEAAYYLPHAIERYQVVQLDEREYPADRAYYRPDEVATVDGRVYLKTDTVPVYFVEDGTSKVKRELRSQITSRAQRAAYVAQGYHINGSGDDIAMYLIHKDHDHAVALYNGKVVHKARHDLGTLYNGERATTQGSRTIRIFNTDVLVPRGAREIDIDKAIQWVLDLRVNDAIAGLDENLAALPTLSFADKKTWITNTKASGLRRLAGRVHSRLINAAGDMTPTVANGEIVLTYRSPWNMLGIEDVRAVVNAVVAGAVVSDPSARTWVAGAKHLLDQIDRFTAHVDALLQQIGDQALTNETELQQLLRETGLATA
jgi:hypothetical protein